MRGDIKSYKFSVHWNHRNHWGHLLFPLSSLQHPGLDDVGVTLHHLLCSILDLAFSSSPEGFEEGANHKVSYLAPHSDCQCYFCIPVLHVYCLSVVRNVLTLIPQVTRWLATYAANSMQCSSSTSTEFSMQVQPGPSSRVHGYQGSVHNYSAFAHWWIVMQQIIATILNSQIN